MKPIQSPLANALIQIRSKTTGENRKRFDAELAKLKAELQSQLDRLINSTDHSSETN